MSLAGLPSTWVSWPAATGGGWVTRSASCRTWTERFAALDDFLLHRIGNGPAPAPEVRWAWRRLVSSDGPVPIGLLARQAGWSHKHLITKFRQQVGLTPKTAARLLRFEHAWRQLGGGEPAHWDRLAADGGYADQSHLIREFREFTGGTPADFLARSIPAAPREPASPGVVPSPAH